MDIEQARQLLSLVKEVTDSLAQEVARNTQALAGISNSVVRILETLDTVPENEDIRKLLKEHIGEHEETISVCFQTHDRECSSRTALAVEREIRREEDLLKSLKEAVEEASTPVKEMHAAYKKVLWLGTAISAIGLTMFGYLKYTLDQIGVK